mmetsp:Transcript_8982/g.27300  ORF Transcript_8982/g.27300 Transcript_8982/m.27300 type:complete len:209 (-) Transcript_8982:202-828(-)
MSGVSLGDPGWHLGGRSHHDGTAQGQAQVRLLGLRPRTLHDLFGQVVTKPNARMPQGTAAPATLAIAASEPPRTDGVERPLKLPSTAGAPLHEDVAVQLAQSARGDAGLPVQPVDVLRDDVLQQARLPQAEEDAVGAARLCARALLEDVAGGAVRLRQLPHARPRRQHSVQAAAEVGDPSSGGDAGPCEGNHVPGLRNHLRQAHALGL